MAEKRLELRVFENSELKKNFKPKCTVNMDNTVEVFNDFVMIGMNNQGDVSIRQYADTITLGKAYHLISKAFIDSYNALTPQEKFMVDSVLKE